jgi:hypothetical protein
MHAWLFTYNEINDKFSGSYVTYWVFVWQYQFIKEACQIWHSRANNQQSEQSTRLGKIRVHILFTEKYSQDVGACSFVLFIENVVKI